MMKLRVIHNISSVINAERHCKSKYICWQAVEKIPVNSKGQADEALIAAR
jgi:hypothetical protein